MPATPDRRVGPDVDEDDLLSRDPTYPDTTYTATRVGGVVTLEEWRRTADSTLLKSITYTRAGGVVTQEDIRVYGPDGVALFGHITATYTRTGGVVTGGTRVRSV